MAEVELDLPPSPGDRIWPQLLLWFDRNHNGVSEPAELVSLPEWNKQNPALAITSFDLNYRPSSIVDANGNRFRFCARIFGPGAGRVTCDVFLVALDSPQTWSGVATYPEFSAVSPGSGPMGSKDASACTPAAPSKAMADRQ